MKDVFGSAKVDIPCPHCGHKMAQTIGKLKTDPKLTCPACNTAFDVDAKGLRAGIQKAENSLADLDRSLRSMSKTFKIKL